MWKWEVKDEAVDMLPDKYPETIRNMIVERQTIPEDVAFALDKLVVKLKIDWLGAEVSDESMNEYHLHDYEEKGKMMDSEEIVKAIMCVEDDVYSTRDAAYDFDPLARILIDEIDMTVYDAALIGALFEACDVLDRYYKRLKEKTED